MYRVYKLRLPTHSKRARLLTVFDVLDSYCHQKKMYNKSKVPNRAEAARIFLKDYVRGKTVYVHCPPTLDRRNREAFYSGNAVEELEDSEVESDGDSVQNVLDHDKLMGNGAAVTMANLAMDSADIDGMNGNDIDIDDDDDDNKEMDRVDHQEITDEEFLKLWKHPLDQYADGEALDKKKKMKRRGSARVQRRVEKRMAKNRAHRRDSDNFVHGSNAVIIEAVPKMRLVNQPM